MKSAVAISYELDDTAVAARQLAAAIREKIDLAAHAVGLLYCDADTDGATLTGALKEALGIEVAGMTTLATLDTNGRHEAAAVLTVLTSDDCDFRVAVSASLRTGDSAAAIEAAYHATVPADAAADARPGLLWVCCPYGMPFSGDRYPEVLSRVAGDAPVMRGVASDDYDYERARTFLSGAAYDDAMVIISLWGGVQPAFSIRHVTSRFAERIRRVSSAEGNVVYTVGDESFIEYLESFGLDTQVPDPLLAFTSYPMMLTREGGDEVPLMRHILELDHAAGSGAFVGDVPVGALANICLVNKADVVEACRESMAALMAELESHPERGYSTVLCISCCGRAMILGTEGDAEGDVLASMLPQGMALAGSYCLGEICPTFYADGKGVNRFHNCSITLCML
ncbi:MAG: hypothetical protein GXY32_04740 [Ruminococcaceae bacterium]|nr:hypothetical protein [Oscillospiraceae bacterium]